jgi:hypothetical protein
VRPFLLAAGLALTWFVLFQEGGVEGDAAPWIVATVIAVRLLVDFVGAWIVLSISRLAFALSRLVLIQLRAHWQQDIR